MVREARRFKKDGPWGYYCSDETAARFAPARETGYRPGLLPE